MTLEEVTKKITPLLGQSGLAYAGVFGSVARGEADSRSDVDILVEFQGPATFDGYMKLKAFLENVLERRVDLLTRRGIRPELAPTIEHDAVYVT